MVLVRGPGAELQRPEKFQTEPHVRLREDPGDRAQARFDRLVPLFLRDRTARRQHGHHPVQADRLRELRLLVEPFQ